MTPGSPIGRTYRYLGPVAPYAAISGGNARNIGAEKMRAAVLALCDTIALDAKQMHQATHNDSYRTVVNTMMLIVQRVRALYPTASAPATFPVPQPSKLLSVKPLEWRDHSFGLTPLWTARHSWGFWEITHGKADWPWVLRPYVPAGSNFQTLEAAKRAAEEEHAKKCAGLFAIPDRAQPSNASKTGRSRDGCDRLRASSMVARTRSYGPGHAEPKP